MSNTQCSLSMLQFNVMLPFLPYIREYCQEQRKTLLPQFFKNVVHQFPDVCIISLNELIPEKYYLVIRNCLKDLGFVYCSRQPNTLLGTGGLCVFSKYCIIQTRFESFGFDCAYSDCLALKGVLYTRVMCVCKKHVVHVFSTHLQAWDTRKAIRARNSQLHVVRTFIDSIRAKSIPGPIVLLGDLNVNLGSDTKQHLESQLGMQMAKISKNSTRYTFDNNNPLVGLDGSYETRDNHRYARGCKDEYEKSGKCQCCIPQWLDYVFFQSANQATSSGCMTAIPCITHDKDGDHYVSDHYPLICELRFDKMSAPRPKCKQARPEVSWCVLL